MSRIIGHTRQIEFFNKLLQKKRLAHAYFFYGPEGVGKFALAKEIAKVLSCDERPTSLDSSCGRCSSCKLTETGQNPEISILDIEHTFVSKKENRYEIPIDDIRELRRRFSLASTSEKWRIAIINQADKMSAEAANAFLKLLEEPGENILFILIAENREGIFPTILSRTQPLGFYPVSDLELSEELKKEKVSPAVIDKIVFYAAGRPERAKKFLADSKLLADEEKMAREINLIFSERNLSHLFMLSERASQDEEPAARIVEYTLRILRSSLKQLASERKSERAQLYVKKIKRADRILTLMQTTNVNTRLALDSFLLEACR